jgi:hypothetical protein
MSSRFTLQKLARAYKTPARIQDFLNSIPQNFEPHGATCKSPLQVLKTGNAHCIEGALLGAYLLKQIGYPPLLLDLRVGIKDDSDFDHVIAPFKKNGYWGALSKTNHAVLRYREPIYKTIRELVLSYFHEYFIDNGRKTLRSYSKPFNISKYTGWETATTDVWYIPEALNNARHIPLLSAAQINNLRRADKIEIQASSLTEWKKKKTN